MSTQKQFARPKPAILDATDVFKMAPKPEHANRVLNRRKSGKEDRPEAHGIMLTAEETRSLRAVAATALQQLIAASGQPDADPGILALGSALLKLAKLDHSFYGGK